MFIIDDWQDEKSVKKKLKTLHLKFGHASENRMKTLLDNYAPLKNGKRWKDILKQTIEGCNVCHDNKKQMRLPKVTAFRCTKFNESIAIDLSEWFDPVSEKKYILCHLIAGFSRLFSGGIIQNKKPEEVIKCIIENWICKYGLPQKILHDNGGEFVNDKVLKFLDILEIRSSPLTILQCHSGEAQCRRERSHV